jgi:tetratricopeptide (TPR) repeat protein
MVGELRTGTIPNGMRTLIACLLMTAVLAGQDRPEIAEVLRQGARLVETGQLVAAQELYEKTLSSFPGDSDLTFELGMVYFRQHNWAKAVENYKSSLSGRPGRVKPLFYLAEAYFMESNLDLARETIAQAAWIAPNDPQVCQKYGQYLSMTVETHREGLFWLQKACRLSPGLAHIDFEIGKTQFELTDFPSAASSFETALQNNSNDGQAAFFLAETWANLSEWEKARERYNYALAQGHANGATYYGLGRALVELGEFEAALVPLQRAVALQPSLIQAHFQLAKAHRLLGRSEEARHEARLFGAMTNRNDTSRELKGAEEENAWKQVKPLVEVNKEQEALELLAKLPVTDGLDRGEPHYLLGVMYFSLGRKADAKRMLSIARAQSPKSARVAAYLGFVELSSGEASAAEESFQSALALDSAEVLALIGMGAIRYQQQRWADAVEYLEKSRTADPDTLYMLCDAYFRLRRTEDAMVTAEVIRALGSDNKTLLHAVDELVTRHKANRQSPAP